MRIAYARVSTDKQELYRQLDALERVGYDKLIQEKFTGTQKKRAGLNNLFNTVRSGDIVIIESISRLGRKTLDILSTVEELKEQGVEVISLKENLDTSTPTGQAMFQMMAVIAQLERDLTVQRVNEGLASAKARGVKLGRPIMDTQKVTDALRLYDSGNYSVKDIIRITGISQGSLYRKIKERESKQFLDKVGKSTKYS
ncbi:recombinase family protein [Carnobacterium inhibens]|uniref:Helix-turn-helix domain-containing protein n=1 Tax=Carnobacterium inhibens TaxID=147709 RepID=A0ABR7TDV7_9LACT|nr:recombinase family protein [Carnobacterium inhibens]MBC9826172.1 helix-turn-helix domain-containing protein [Carnobacterium inhibens]